MSKRNLKCVLNLKTCTSFLLVLIICLGCADKHKAETVVEAEPEVPKQISAECVDGNLRVREQPVLSAFVMGHLNPPDIVEVLHRSYSKVAIGEEWDYWLHIMYDGKEAWSYAAWLVPDVPMNDVPVYPYFPRSWTSMGQEPPMDLAPYPAIAAADNLQDSAIVNILPESKEPNILQDIRTFHSNLLVINAETPNEMISISAVDPEGTRYEANLFKGKNEYSISDVNFRPRNKNALVSKRSVIIPFQVPATFVSGKWEISIALDTGQIIHQSVPVFTEDFSILQKPVRDPFDFDDGPKGRQPQRTNIPRGERIALYISNRPVESQIPILMYQSIKREESLVYYPVCGTRIVTDIHGRGQTVLLIGQDLPKGVYHFSWKDLVRSDKGFMDSIDCFETYIE